jgi:transposase-like protein
MNDNQQDSLMIPDERTVCEQIAATGGSPHSLRAQALLALDTGASQEEAAAQSGLTPNQVKYWLGRFRNNRLTIFPDELVTSVPQSTSETEPATFRVDTSPEVKVEGEETAVAPAKAGTKPKKKKGTKKAKGKKEAKKKSGKKKKDKKGKKNKKAGKKKAKK